MSPEVYIIAGIIIGLIFTELTGLSPGGIIVPGYLALFLKFPPEIIITGISAIIIMLIIKLISHHFFLFGRRRYALCLLMGILLKLGIEYFSPGLIQSLSYSGHITGIKLIGWLIPGIIANDMYKQGIKRTVLGAATVTSLVFLVGQVFGR